MPVTIRDIARQLGVSHTTVSRVLNSKQDTFISQGTRERVLTAAQEMGYYPNRLARALAGGRTHMITLWINETHAPFYGRMVYYFQQHVWENNYEMVISAYSGETGLLLGSSEVSGWPSDGIIAVDLLRSMGTPLSALPMPVVTLGVFYDPSVDYVGVDLNAAATEVMSHLLEPGPRRVAYLGIAEPDQRHSIYTRAVREAGLEPEYIIVPNGLRACTRSVVRDYVKAHGCPEAIFCHNDDGAIGAYRGLRDLGIRIPDDVALVGCDGIEDTEYLDTPISTVAQPSEEMCRLGWEYLKRRMADPSLPLQQTVLQARLVIRESSRR
ncbi:MAG: LacI family DNA-binding transcriptional regulator [Armatimonadetes bacterium]|nr:LacI family DNA-binding transcriptional regulator [Armatimonadota bacterium]